MISVVIPLYNKAHTIVNTLQTVVNQTYRDFEVVIVNDGSTDDGVEVINRNFNDDRIRIVNQENAGVSVARNRGVDEAKGDWIAFLDGDDEWMPTYLENIVNAIQIQGDCGIFITARYSQNFQTKRKSTTIPSKYKGKVSKIEFFENPHVFMHISATVIKSTLLHKDSGWNRFAPGQKSNEDFTFLFRIALHTNVCYIGIPLSIYNGNVGQQATSTLESQQRIKDGALFRNKVFEEWVKTGSVNKVFKIFMEYETRHVILGYLRRKAYKELHEFLEILSPEYKRDILNRLELFLYNNQSLSCLSITYIYMTKVVWRMHNYPIV